MTDTGWKHPTILKQYGGGLRGVINKGTCYAFKNLDNIKKEDDTYADQHPWAYNGVDSDHKSPYVYAYNYGFNIPNDATVTKIILYARVNQLTHPKRYYEEVVLKRKIRFSASKFSNVKLKQGASVNDEGTGNQMADKCAVPMLGYKLWTTEDMTTFSGTPAQWGLTGNVNGVINSNNFGVVIQFVGTIKNAWCNPGIAKLKMKIEYTTPQVKVIPDSTFSKIAVYYGNKEIEFDSTHTSTGEKICDLTRNDYNNPAVITFKYYHKGKAGETPLLTLESASLSMGADAKAHDNKTDAKNKYSLSKLQCNEDETEKEYSQNVYIFPGVNVGTQTVTYTYNNIKYTLKFNVLDDMDEDYRSKFIDQNQVCIIQNCLFYRNHALKLGGANCITSEFYNGKNNIYGTGTDANKADNINNENNGEACPNTIWRNVCNND